MHVRCAARALAHSSSTRQARISTRSICMATFNDIQSGFFWLRYQFSAAFSSTEFNEMYKMYYVKSVCCLLIIIIIYAEFILLD